MDDFVISGNFPGIVTLKKNSHKMELDQAQFFQILVEHKPKIEEWLHKHGALLFRGFPLSKADDFTQFIESLNLGQFVNYIGGDSPRDKVASKVYTSTEAPPSLHIPLHQELSFIKKFPKHIYFFCEIAPSVGGSTIIGDARKIYESVRPDVRIRFQEKTLTYISNYYETSLIMRFINKIQRSHKSWREVFETTSQADVEEHCKTNEFDWQWNKNNWLQVKQKRPATINHPITEEIVWFNQAHLYDFNPRLLGFGKYLGAKLLYVKKSMRLHEIRFGDESRIPKKDLYHVMDVLEQNTVAFPWQRGDVMVLDNILAMHGRAPFKGKRRILTALTT